MGIDHRLTAHVYLYFITIAASFGKGNILFGNTLIYFIYRYMASDI